MPNGCYLQPFGVAVLPGGQPPTGWSAGLALTGAGCGGGGEGGFTAATAPLDVAAVVVAAAALSSPPTRRLDAAAGMPALPLHLTVRWAKCRSVHCRCRPDAALAEEVVTA